MDSKDFFIGWSASTSRATKRLMTFTTLALLLLCIGTAFMLVKHQRSFVNSNYELGKLTIITGTLMKQPVPMLRMTLPGQSDLTADVLLVGFGKRGAEAAIQEAEDEHGTDLEGKWVELEGTLFYYDGKVGMELTNGAKAFQSIDASKMYANMDLRKTGSIRIQGEIADPKCFLGVMKPGFGKIHRSCAVRCLSGGIPALFRQQDGEGHNQYFLLLDGSGELCNEMLLDFVADQVQLTGDLYVRGEWSFVRIDDTQRIVRLQPHWMEGPVMTCSDFRG